MGDFEDSFAVMLTRLTYKMIANGVRSAGAFRDRAQELKNFIDAGNPEQPFDFFSAADLGAELYNEVKNMLREVLIRFPRNIDREGYKNLISLVFNQAIRRHRREQPGNMQNGGRRRTRRGQGRRTQRNTRRSRR